MTQDNLIARLRDDIAGWEQAYPLSAFPEPDLKRAAEILKANGMTLDAISASNMRHVVSKLAPLIHEALDEIERLSPPLDGEGVIQADRDRAKSICGAYPPPIHDAIENGKADHHPFVQAFAAHRRDVLAALPREADELRRIAEAFPPKPKCCEPRTEYDRAMREEVIPQIEADMKAQGRAAHFARLGIPDPAAAHRRAALASCVSRTASDDTQQRSCITDFTQTASTPREDEVERHAKDLALATELEQLGCDEAAKRLRTLTIWACGPNGVRWYIEKLQEAQKALATLTPREQRMGYERRILAAECEGVQAERQMRERAVALCEVAASAHADMALDGLPEQARAREAMEAMATKLRHQIAALPLTLGNEPIAMSALSLQDKT